MSSFEADVVRHLSAIEAEIRNIWAKLLGSQGREVLTAARTYYVNPSTGSDTAYDGRSATVSGSSGPFATIQRAVDIVALGIDLGGYQAIIQLADGTYTLTAPIDLRPCAGQNYTFSNAPTIRGNTTTPANVVLNRASNMIGTQASGGGCEWVIEGIRFTSSGSDGVCLAASYNAQIAFRNCEFGATSGYHIYVQRNGAVFATGNYTILGGAAAHLCINTAGTIWVEGITVTLTGTPAWTTSFALCVNGLGVIRINGNTFSGAATGQRYYVDDNGVIFTNLGGATYLPGNVAGGAAAGGQYI